MNVLIKSLAAIAARIPMPKQSGENKYEKYKYSTRDDIFDVVRAEFATEGIVWLPSSKITRFEEAPPTKSGIPQFRTHVIVKVEMYHIEDTLVPLILEWTGEAVTNTDRGASMATTTAIRTGFVNLFMLMGDYDPSEHAAKSSSSNQNVRTEKPATSSSTSSSTSENENRQIQSNIDKLILNAGCDADTTLAFVKRYLPSIEARKGNNLHIDKWPVALLQKWFDALAKNSKDELKAKVEKAVAELE